MLVSILRVAVKRLMTCAVLLTDSEVIVVGLLPLCTHALPPFAADHNHLFELFTPYSFIAPHPAQILSEVVLTV